MHDFAIDWLVVILRWTHIVAILGWVGASLYFMWLDSKLRQPGIPRPNVLGEAWMGHGGGFYIVEKRQIAPGQVPSPVYWFRNEAAVTWVTGFLLLVFTYYGSGGADLIDADKWLQHPGAAVAVAIGFLVVCWLVYDFLWASPFAASKPAMATAISAVLLFVIVYSLCMLFAGRAAYIHVGSILGTCMVGNVWRRIIPAQQEAVAATSAGRERNMVLALRARRRAQHNTYLTLPVIFTMIAAHAPSTFAHPLNWLIMTLLIVAGIAARQMMLLFDRRVPNPSGWLSMAGVIGVTVIVLAVVTAPRGANSPAPATAAEQSPSIHVVRGIVELRCAGCHAQKPSVQGLTAAPGGVRLDSIDELAKNAAKINASAVATRSMPPGNSTGMTEEERVLLARWVTAGAQAR